MVLMDLMMFLFKKFRAKFKAKKKLYSDIIASWSSE